MPSLRALPRRHRITLVVACVALLAGGVALVARRGKNDDVAASGATTSTSAAGGTTTTAEATTTTAQATTTTATTTVPGTDPATSAEPGAADPSGADDPGTAPPPPPNTALPAISLRALAAVPDPIAAAAVPGQPGVLYVASRGGRVYLLRGTALSAPVLDISAQVGTQGEEGLLGIAVTPDGSRLAFSFTNPNNTRVDIAPLRGDGTVDAAARTTLFTQTQPSTTNHKGGNIAFGPDGALWLGLGDGGGGGDPNGNAQNGGTFLGKMIRIDPNGGGASIVDIGLRNPWRWSFDRATGDLWIGDVGQDAYEEVDHLPAGTVGANLGWNRREGFHAYQGGASLPGDWEPIWEYPHTNQRCAVTGGYVYRGAAVPELYGAYLFSDACHGDVRGLRLGDDGRVVAEASLGASLSNVISFAEDAAGELYVLSFDGHVYAVGG